MTCTLKFFDSPLSILLILTISFSFSTSYALLLYFIILFSFKTLLEEYCFFCLYPYTATIIILQIIDAVVPISKYTICNTNFYNCMLFLFNSKAQFFTDSIWYTDGFWLAFRVCSSLKEPSKYNRRFGEQFHTTTVTPHVSKSNPQTFGLYLYIF